MQLQINLQAVFDRRTLVRVPVGSVLYARPAALCILVDKLPHLAKRPDVCLRGVGLHARVYLRRPIPRSAHVGEAVDARVRHVQGRPEVAELAAARGDEEVVGLDVQVGEALPVQVGERAHEVAEQLRGVRAGALLHVAGQAPLGAELQDHVERLPRVRHADQLHHAGMTQPLQYLRLLKVPLDRALRGLVANALHHDALLGGGLLC
mmetsp:Transcript_104606/g.278345  ORF Transcript_104606/g.278345 Transcript_104606/m.278345 type:complete len:207 (-) Transcript_104606:806-1426(-)